MKFFIKKTADTGSKKRSIKKRILLGLGALLVLCCIGLGIFIWVAVAGTPQWDPDKLNKPRYASLVYDKDGNEIAQLSFTESRLPFNFEDMPELLVQTIIAVEDKKFYDHGGYDLFRMVKYYFNSNQNQGSSTITMQLAKNTFIPYENRVSVGVEGFKRKIQEMTLAMQIERNYTKDEILTAYMTHVFFGQGAYGARSAALIYFGKDLDQLTIPDIALLCGLPNAPSTYNPYLNPDRAKEQRTYVLSVMRDEGLITAEEFEQHKDDPFTYVESVKAGTVIEDRGLHTTIKYPFFVDYIVKTLESQYGLSHDDIYNGGLRIYTTIDPNIQQAAEEAMKNPDNFPGSRGNNSVQGAIVMLDNATGDIVSMVGGREYTAPFGYNRATDAMRQLGPAATPVISYAAAIEYGGYNANTIIVDAPVTFGGWSPKNTSGTYSGPISMRQAISKSVNIYAVKLYDEVGPEYCWNFAKNMGLEMPGTNYSNYSNALGSFSANPLEVTLAYSAFPNKGIANKPRCVTKVIDVNGVMIYDSLVESRRVMKETTALAMNDLLRSAVTGGAGAGAAIDNWYICGMTGITSSEASGISGYPDAWFVGYSPHYTGAVWMGYDVSDRDHYLLKEDGNLPALIWNQVMTKALEGLPVQASIP
jgi:penicillin-binding protein 1A